MRRLRFLVVAAVVILAPLMISGCLFGPWWQPPGEYSCLPPAMYRIDSGAPHGLGACPAAQGAEFRASLAPNVSLQRGQRLEIHFNHGASYSAPSSSEPSVLGLSGRSNGDATSTFVAKSIGSAVVSIQGQCVDDSNNITNGTCQLLQITVS